MYKIIDENGAIYKLYKYEYESEFESVIFENANTIFGKDGIYFNIKKLIGKPKKGAAIPDGYYLDLTFHNDPKLYLVEVELQKHDVYGHIGDQILRFGISSETDKYRMKSFLLDNISHDESKKSKLNDFFNKSKYNNTSELLDRVIFDNKPTAIIVIDHVTDELNNVLSQLARPPEVIEVQTYFCGDKKLHRFTPFKDDVIADLPDNEDADELDTIVVPARDDGFNEEFITNNRWYAIRISSVMLDKIKYIAAYQVAPISGITHISEVDRIEKYKDTNKYIIYFKPNTTRKINKVALGNKKGQAPQAPRYSSFDIITNAQSLDDLWK